MGGPAPAASQSSLRPPSCALVSRIHCLTAIESWEDITLNTLQRQDLAEAKDWLFLEMAIILNVFAGHVGWTLDMLQPRAGILGSRSPKEAIYPP